MRESGVELAAAFSDGVRAEGVDIIDLGMASTDFLYFASGHLDAPGAMFTASHNPAQYNGLKLCLSGARPIGRDTGLADIEAGAEELLGAPLPPLKGSWSEQDLLGEWADHVVSFVDVSSLRPLKVVADTANGMGGLVVPIVFERLPFAVEILFPELDGNFPNHPADPIQPENLVALKAAVLEQGADIGLAFDGDADRVFLVDEKAEPVSGSLTTALVAASMLTKHPGETILYNLICSHVVPEVVTEMGGTPVRTQVGHSIIKKVMAETGAVFGGEHSGHYYYRDNFRADSGIITALLVLELLSQSDAAALRDAPAVPALRGLGGDQHDGHQSRGHRRGHRRARAQGRSVGRHAGRAHRRTRRLVVQRPSLQHRAVAPTQRGSEDSRALRRPRGRGAAAHRHPRRPDGRPELRSSPMSLDPLLLDVLACPVDKGPLLWFEDEDVLYNPRLKKSYAVVDGVPVLLSDEAVTVGEPEHERLMAKAESEKVRATGSAPG